MGYRSVHFVCVLRDDRSKLPEYEGSAGLKFEIQLRTVLQHAWAELAHDRSFKFRTVLPLKLQRKLNLFSGLLEVVDNGFDEIARDIDQYQESITATPVEELVHEEINSISIQKYLAGIAEKYGLTLLPVDDHTMALVIEELRLFGVGNLGELKRLEDPNFMMLERKISRETRAGLLRNIMAYADIDRYFSIWSPRHWTSIDRDSMKLLSKKYGNEKVRELLKNKKIAAVDEE